MTYKKINNLLGWLVFAIASAVYIVTSEPTASFWDCGEYIATAFKLQVGHPPGAPTFQLVARFLSLFAFGDLTQVARMVNSLSALASGFTILFLFWSITALAKKIGGNTQQMSFGTKVAIFGSGLVGALAYTFSDTFWFSAVEGEVYAFSSFFTAFVFWAILKWEEVADKAHATRWIILIFFMVGLSIGVHLLNLLALPAIMFVFYYKKYKPTKRGIFITLFLSVILLAVILYGIIPMVVWLSGKFEIFFVNVVRLPFNSGTIIYFLLLFGSIIYGIYYTHKHKKYLANTILLCLTFVLIGYSTFFTLVIRSHSNPPIDENNPEDAVSLLSYLNREQYGETPLFYGPYFNAPQDRTKPAKDGTPVYGRDDRLRKYVVIDPRENVKPNYDSRFCTIFPRMWSPDNGRGHPEGYKSWANIKGTPIQVQGQGGKPETIYKPTFSENLKFFFKYQVGYMYFRYFMWNFAGRQNDSQGFGNPLDGNWISGIKFLDEWRLGPQNYPQLMKNDATNKFYMLPLLLGIIGLLFQIKKSKKDAFIVALLFFFTGLAIVLYLNQSPNQPRERDYAYAASFYAFAIWIGFGVYAIFDWVKKKLSDKIAAIAATLVCLLLVPTIMAKEGWNDHDRSNRYMARDFAKNYLESCAPNAVLFTHGDNDTFPLWYAQDVEGIRTDVRVIVLTLFNTDWYVNQMRNKVYESEPLKFSIPPDKIASGKREFVYITEKEELKDYISLSKLLEFVASDDPRSKLTFQGGIQIEHFPTKNFRVPVDSAKVVNNGTVPKELADSVVKNMDWRFERNLITKNYLMMLDLIASSNWERPIYFAVNGGSEPYLHLEKYFQQEGLAYRLVPAKMSSHDGQVGRINTAIMYDNMMNKFTFGNINKDGIYIDETIKRQVFYIQNYRNQFGRLANALIQEGKKDSALAVLDRCMEVLPLDKLQPDYFTLPLAEGYYKLGKTETADNIVNQIVSLHDEALKYYYSFPSSFEKSLQREKYQSLAILQQTGTITEKYNRKDIHDQVMQIFNTYYSKFRM